MKYTFSKHDQRTPEWHQDRLGKLTMSVADKLITKTGNRSSSAEELVNRLVAELIAGKPDETFQSEAMLRGSELEDEALKFINFTYGYNFQKVGFADTGLGYGCSVDGYDFENDVFLEMKIPSLHTHLAYLAGNCVPKGYKPQTQGHHLVLEARGGVFMSYHPDVKPLVKVIDRDEPYIKSLKEILNECCEEVAKKYKELTEILEEEIA